MKLNIPKEWFESRLQQEGDCEIGAGGLNIDLSNCCGKWINIKERLPRIDGNFIVICDKKVNESYFHLNLSKFMVEGVTYWLEFYSLPHLPKE